jgi:hypothetical protein
MRRISFKMIGTGLAVAISLLILLIAAGGLIRLGIRSREAGRTVAREAIERAVMQCYALEGAYPPNLDYLSQNYGLILDESRYVYLYEVVAGNIHPIIGVQFPGENE